MKVIKKNPKKTISKLGKQPRLHMDILALILIGSGKYYITRKGHQLIFPKAMGYHIYRDTISMESTKGHF
jgi:CTP-dependent riboflavin kinase